MARTAKAPGRCQYTEDTARPASARRVGAAYVQVRRKGAIMFCNNCNNSSLWLIILIIVLFGYGGNGCGCGCGNECGCGNNCGSGCGCCN